MAGGGDSPGQADAAGHEMNTGSAAAVSSGCRQYPGRVNVTPWTHALPSRSGWRQDTQQPGRRDVSSQPALVAFGVPSDAMPVS